MAKSKPKGAANTATKVPGKPFKAGAEWSGNKTGRPKGSRNKIAEDFVAAMADDFAKNGVKVISTVRSKNPGMYLKIVADLVPKDFHIEHSGSEAFMQLWQRMAG